MSIIRREKIFLCGHNGMLGSAIHNELKKKNFKILTIDKKKLDLREKVKVFKWFKKFKPDIVINAAGKVGGIIDNSENSLDYFNDNLSIGINVINASYRYNVKKLINIGSSCIYPKLSKQPIKEKYLLTGELEKTNEAYALAKICCAKLCDFYFKKRKKSFITLMPTNLYGPKDNYDLYSSHVLAALIKKIHIAKKKRKKNVILFGNGKPLREFLYVEDAAKAISMIVKKPFKKSIINLGSSHEISILKLAKLISSVIGYKVNFVFDKKKPNGTPRKLLDSSIIKKMGWRPKIKLRKGIELAYKDFIE